MLQHKTTTPGGCQQAAAFVLPLTDKQGRGERCKGISRKGTIMCRNTVESRKLFYSGCILNIRASPHNSRLTAQAPLRRLRHGICVAKMLDNVGLRYSHRASGAKAPRTLRPLPLLRFAVSATGGAHLCSIQYYLRFWLSSCRTSLVVSALRIMRYCPKLTGPDPATEQRSHRQTCRLCRRCSSGSGRFPYHRGYCRYQTGCVP